MENIDKAMESRVWQRVRPGEIQPHADSLKPWILAAQENAAACRSLSLQLIGKQWECLRRLENECSRMAHSLRGLSALRGEIVKLTPLPTPREAPRRTLEKSFHRSRRICKALEGQTGDPEYGMVFRNLARQAGEHCCALVELLGRLEG